MWGSAFVLAMPPRERHYQRYRIRHNSQHHVIQDLNTPRGQRPREIPTIYYNNTVTGELLLAGVVLKNLVTIPCEMNVDFPPA